MTTRYLSVFLPRLPTDRLKRRAEAFTASSGTPEASAEVVPLVTVSKVKGAQRIRSVDLDAERRAIRPGMTLADARALCPTLVVAEADPAAEAALLMHVVDWGRRFTPLAAPDGEDGMLLDIGGAAHLYGGEASLLAAVEAGLRRQGLLAQGAIASTPEAAWALARFSTCKIAPLRTGGFSAPLGEAPPSRGEGAPVEGKFEALLAALPLAALRLDADMLGAMAQAGLRRIEDLLLRPRAPLTARFGPQAFARLDGVLGRTKSPISPRFEVPAYVAERRFASGITQKGDVVAALLPLARHLCALLTRQGEGARRIEATLFRVDGLVRRIVVGTSRPNRAPETIVGLFRERIERLDEEGLDTGYGFDLIRLAVLSVETQHPVQDRLDRDDFGPHRSHDTSATGSPESEPRHLPAQPPDAASADLADLADRLGARLGVQRVLRFAECGTHIPEYAAVAVPAAQSRSEERTIIRDGGQAKPCRPIRLFDKPEPIVALAAVPDGPPLKFRWRRVVHDIAAIEGPERIAPEWWREETAFTRDYFRAEDRQGRRFWLFREGLLGRETAEARWFLHGLFG